MLLKPSMVEPSRESPHATGGGAASEHFRSGASMASKAPAISAPI